MNKNKNNTKSADKFIRILHIKTNPQNSESDAVVVDHLVSKARHVYLSGVIDNRKSDLAGQMKDALGRIDNILRRAGGSLANIISMRTSIQDLIPEKQWIYSGVRKEVFDNAAIWPGPMYPASMLTGGNLGLEGVEVKIYAHAIYEIPDQWEISETPHFGIPLQYTYGKYVRRQNLLSEFSNIRGYSQAVVIDYLLTGVREVYPAGFASRDFPNLKEQTDKTFEVLIDIIKVCGGTVEDIHTMFTSIPNLDIDRQKIYIAIAEKYFGRKNNVNYPANMFVGTGLATYIATVEIMPIAKFITPKNWQIPDIYHL